MIGRKGNLNYLKIVKYAKDNNMFQLIIIIKSMSKVISILFNKYKSKQVWLGNERKKENMTLNIQTN